MHSLDSPDHAGGWSVDASVTIEGWDRQGLERLVRYCARPPLAQERLGRLNDELLVYRLRRSTVDGRTGLILTPPDPHHRPPPYPDQKWFRKNGMSSALTRSTKNAQTSGTMMNARCEGP